MTDALKSEYDVASILSVGARERQEDAVAVAFPDRTDLGFAVLSDGMGGHAAGDLASRAIVAEMFASLTLREATAATPIPEILCGAVRRANEGVKACIEASPDHGGMGGTVVATQISGDKLHWISVGDSVLYLFRDQKLRRLNADHSMAPQLDLMVAKGAMTQAEAEAHPQRNCLTSAITGGPIDEVDCPDRPIVLEHDDIVLQASDGLQFLPDPIIEALLLRARNNSSQQIARDLMDALDTLNDPEQDNTSIVVIRANAPGRQSRKGILGRGSGAMVKALRRAVKPAVVPAPGQS
ncbi:PP2C family protein-serine/threonine phosphatase [Jannaschia sp. CCS1]|uniref:PP2C family protein-serine/threonine phosphatase n=1 Tax=Jannaschia sp. (strain CCS1) TaxID=290400 RepID=UPI000053B3D7|nr:protein phosphatase 2C domain-containing protein [Jannaschia sp. CCS1]ABD57060.1 protein serine/threonine phosphatase [Jannaschia sp. CCS1]